MHAKISFVASLILLLVACKPDEKPGSQAPDTIRIVCTTGIIGDMLSDLTKGIAGAEVHSLMGPGVDPHLYKASQQDIGKIQDADLVVYNGLHLEGKMTEVLASLGNARSLALGDFLPDSLLLHHDEAPDPHFWFDARLWARAAASLSDSLLARFPQYRVQLEQNAADLQSRLQVLHSELTAAFEALPAERRVLVTAHDAFGYYGRAYGVEVHGLQGISTQAEFGLQDLSAMVTFLSDHRIPAIFVESSISPRSMQAVKEGCEKRGHSVSIGGTLYSDALGEPGTEAGNYAGMLRYNTRTIVDALKEK